QQQSQEVSIRPTFFFRPNGNLLVDPARVRQVETPEVNLELALRQFQTLGCVVVLLWRHRCTSRIFLTSFLMGSPPGKLVNAEENARCRRHRKLALAVPVPWRGEEPQLHGSAECRAADPRRSTTAVAGDERSR